MLQEQQTTHNIIWEPLPGSQSLALSCPCDEILYEGTRGPGKSDTTLMRFATRVGIGYGQYWRGVIFRREYGDLEDIISKSKRWFPQIFPDAKFLASKGDLKWVFATGEELLFRAFKRPEDYWKYHGQELPFIGWEELTAYPDDKCYEDMMSCNRSSFQVPEDRVRDLPPIPVETFSTTNPYGPGHSWVKRRFIDLAAPGNIIKREYKIKDPKTQKDIILTRHQVRIFGSYSENPYLDPAYVAKLLSIKDPNKRKAWIEGDWNVTSGGRFDHLWREQVHVVEPFIIPAGWHVDRSHDWGEAKPFSNLWFAEANGETITTQSGKKWTPAKGSVFVIGEWYGNESGEDNVGVRLSSTNVAKGVAWIDKRLTGSDSPQPTSMRGDIMIQPGIIKGKVKPGPADNAINTKADGQSISDKMKVEGVRWTASDKSPGSRVNGAALLCDYLEGSIEANENESGVGEKPGLYFFDYCRGIISRFPTLPRDTKNPDDIDTDAPDHDYDSLRYRIGAKKRGTFSVSYG